jgi:hypothetical protein
MFVQKFQSILSHKGNKLTPIETLQSFQSAVMREFKKRIEEKDAPRLWYEQTATKLLKTPTDVQFVESLFDEVTGFRLNGSIERHNGKFFISLKSNLPLKQERLTFCHEIAHGFLGHVQDGTPTEYEQGQTFKQVFLNGTVNKAMKIDARKIYQDIEAKQEQEADKIALQLYRLLWQE